MKHLAIIADGNRRWAKDRQLPVKAGYVQGLNTIENCCMWAIANDIKYLTVFCFSTENWQRTKGQIDTLFALAEEYLEDKASWYINCGIKVLFSGRRERFDLSFRAKMLDLEVRTKECNKLVLIICIDYGGRDEIVMAIENGAKTEQEISSFMTRLAPEPDLILRTGGRKRLSNFLLWQGAYSELFFTDELFPSLTTKHLDQIKDSFEGIKRNFGK